MGLRAAIVAGLLTLWSCTSVRSVQLRPPAPIPPGLIWGYGVEKLRGNPEQGRQGAYLKAIDDLLTRGPVLVSKTVVDKTTVIDVRSSRRTMESSFRLRASRMLQPSFMDTGVEDGFVWVLIGTSEADIERGWQQFLEWRVQKIEHASMLFESAGGPERLAVLKAAFELLQEIGAQDDPTLLYYQVKNALDAELSRIAELERLQKRFRAVVDSGELASADMTLDRALRLGLDPETYRQLNMEIANRRKEAAHLIAAGDDLLRDEQYKEALDTYRRAQRLDRDNPQLPSRLAMAERHRRTARAETVRSTMGIGITATRALSEYFIYKREQERRKRAQAQAREAQAREAAKRTSGERKTVEKDANGDSRESTPPGDRGEQAGEKKPEDKQTVNEGPQHPQPQEVETKPEPEILLIIREDADGVVSPERKKN